MPLFLRICGAARSAVVLVSLLVSIASCSSPSPLATPAAPPIENRSGVFRLATLGAEYAWYGDVGPEFALYSDGTVLYYDESAPGQDGYRIVRLEGDEFDRLSELLAPSTKFLGLESRYRLSKTRDLPTTMLALRSGDGMHEVRMYGLRNREKAAPASFIRYYDLMNRYAHPRAEPWRPRYLKLTITSASSVPASPDLNSSAWPAAWPVPKPQAIQDGQWTATLYLGSQCLADVRRIFPGDHFGVEHYVSFDGRYWSGVWNVVYPDGEEDARRESKADTRLHLEGSN